MRNSMIALTEHHARRPEGEDSAYRETPALSRVYIVPWRILGGEAIVDNVNDEVVHRGIPGDAHGFGTVHAAQSRLVSPLLMASDRMRRGGDAGFRCEKRTCDPPCQDDYDRAG